MEQDLVSDKDIERAYKKFRKATEHKLKMESLEDKTHISEKTQGMNQTLNQTINQSNMEEPAIPNSKRGEERGMSHNEYVNLKNALKAKLKKMIPVSFEMLDQQVYEIEKHLQKKQEEEGKLEKQQEKSLEREID